MEIRTVTIDSVSYGKHTFIHCRVDGIARTAVERVYSSAFRSEHSRVFETVGVLDTWYKKAQERAVSSG